MSCHGIAAVNGSGSFPVMLKPPLVTSGEQYEWRYSRCALSEARLRKRSCSPQRGQRNGREEGEEEEEEEEEAPQAWPFLSERKEPEPLEHNFCCITLHLQHREEVTQERDSIRAGLGQKIGILAHNHQTKTQTRGKCLLSVQTKLPTYK